MKRCLSCNRDFEAATWICPACGRSPQENGSFLHFAPALADSNDGFDEHGFDSLHAVEDGNFWFEARSRIIVHFIGKHFLQAKNFMEVGCGTGFVLTGIRKAFPSLQPTGTEIYASGLSLAAKRLGNQADFLQMDGRDIPFTGEYDLIGAFDCIEHIEEDEKVLQEIHRALKPGGGAVFTVPQHPFMWSAEDDRAHHKRRYTRGELQQKMEKAGFEVLASTSFTTLLFPLMVLDRLLRKRKPAGDDPQQVQAGLRLPPLVNKAFSLVCAIEFFLIRSGIPLPFGGSRLVIGRKR